MNAIVELIREVGVYRLADFQGCLCGSFAVKGVEVDISCRKSDGAMDRIAPEFYGIKLRVHSRSLDADGAELAAVAREVADQLRGEGYRIMIRFCEYKHDYDRLCIYCGKDREEAAEYLCESCKAKDYFGEKIADRYAYRQHEFTLDPESA